MTTDTMSGEAGGTMLEHALAYYRLGLSVVPVHPTLKKPATMWGGKQNERADENELGFWFENPDSPHRIGVVCGTVSGNLAVRDFDSMAAYQHWATEHPTFAETLPTVETGRPGRHLYLRTTDCPKTRSFDDGEFRGAGAFVVAPPSRHETGKAYQWLCGIPATIPEIDPEQAGLLRCWAPTRDAPGSAIATESTESTESTEDIVSVLSVVSRADVARAIQQTRPLAEGQRHHRLFEFARRLKAIPELADLQAAELRDVVKAWHLAALPTITTKDFESTSWDFAEGWEKVRYPAGSDPVQIAIEQAMKDDAPKCAAQYGNPKVQLLVKLCRRLQGSAGNAPFFLACRRAGKALGEPHDTVARWLRGLVRDGVLERTGSKDQGGGGRRAFRYRYLGD
jgi:hypothetical protein